MKLKTIITIYLISLGILLYSAFFGIRHFNIAFKANTSILFVILPFIFHQKGNNKKYFKNIALGLFLSYIGDVALVLDNNRKDIAFILGVISFAYANISYIMAFCNIEKFKSSKIFNILFFLIPIFILVNFTNFFDFQGLQLIINIYAVIICTMVGMSLNLIKYYKQNPYFVRTTILGAVLFWASDVILLFAYFGINCDPRLEVLNNLVYYIAQSLFGLSFMKELIINKEGREANVVR